MRWPLSLEASVFGWGDRYGENAGVSLRWTDENRVPLSACLDAFTGGFLPVMPLADTAQVGKAVIVSSLDVIHLSGLVPATFSVALRDFTSLTATVESLCPQRLPVRREA
jgi:hypothetical protein